MIQLKKLANLTASKYVASGLLQTFAGLVTGFIVLRWINPTDLGRWQSFTVFLGYVQFVTLGVNNGINRELPFWLGKGKKKLAISKLKAGGYFINMTFFILFLLILFSGISLYAFEVFNLDQAIMLLFVGSIGLINIQKSFLGATFRTSKEFKKLSFIQVLMSIIYLFLIPLIYFFDIWGYVIYQFLIAGIAFILFYIYRPFKVSYIFDVKELKSLIKIGFPIFFWNYIGVISRSIPRLVLVLFGTPILVGLFAPASNINNAVLALPKFLNRFLFPKLSFKFGQNENSREIYQLTIKAAKYLLLFMLLSGIILAFIVPYVFPIIFPKYIEGIVAAQIMIFSGVFYSINMVFHNSLNSLKEFSPFKYLLSFRLMGIILFSYLAYYWLSDLLLAVSFGAALTELINSLNYFYFLRKVTLKKS